MRTDFVIDALEQALYARQPERNELVHHSDRGSQYVSIKYSERLAEAGIEPSVGSKGDSDDNALAETINGLYKAELNRPGFEGHRPSVLKTGNVQSKNRMAATTVGTSAPSSSPDAPIDSSLKPRRSNATPAGLGALAMTVRPPPATAPATRL